MLEACARLRSLLFSSAGFSLRQRNAAALPRCLARLRLRSLVCKNVKLKRTTPALSRIRNSSQVASRGTGRNACATQHHRVALLFGSMSRHLPAGLTRIARFSIVLSAILMLTLPAARTASFAQTDRTAIKVASFAELAQQL